MLDHIGLGQRVCGEVYLISDGMLEGIAVIHQIFWADDVNYFRT